MNIKNKITCYICIISLFITSFLTISFRSSLNKNFYLNFYNENNISITTGLSEDDLETSLNLLIDYIQGKADSLDYETNVNYSTREVFNNKEKLHMQDVRNLYQNLKTIRNIFVVIFLVSLLFVFLTKQYKYLFIVYKNVLKIFFVLLAVIVIFVYLDFETFWDIFHKIFFTNNLFYLDPLTDILIMMMPEKLFALLVKEIVLYVVLFYLVIYILLKLIDRELINKC